MAKKKRGNNEGSISKRASGNWRAQLYIRGKRISFGSKTKAECLAWLNKNLEQQNQGIDLLGGETTVAEYVIHWLETAKTALRPKTAIQYEHLVRSKIIPNIGDIKIKNLKLDRIEDFYTQLSNSGCGVRTVRLTHSVLHRALERAVRLELVPLNRAHGATLPRIPQHEMNVFDEGQISSFLVAAHGTRNEALYHLAITTGMRQGELFGLKWFDLKWSSGTIQVQRQVQHVPYKGWGFSEPKTRNGRRMVKLGEATLQVLRAHKERQEVEKMFAGDRWQDYDLIFPTTVGTPMNPSGLHLDFYRFLEQAGLPRIRFHDLRHTAASLMLNHNVPIIVVSRILGHSRPSITLDVYGHLYMEMQDEAARIIDELITPVQIQIPTKQQA